MSEYAKELPAELRNKSATSSAEVHRSLGAGGSLQAPASAFRSKAAGDKGDEAFETFAQGSSSTRAVPDGGSRPRRASSVIVSSWTGEDLAPRETDGQAVLDLLKRSGSIDELNESLEELQSRRQQEWQTLADNATPTDPASSDPLSKDAFPYLFDLLSLPEDQSISAYLDMTSYTDDVWGLPTSLKQDLDRAKGLDDTSADAQQKALERLQMLREHLYAKASEHQQPAEAATFMPAEWERIWQLRLS